MRSGDLIKFGKQHQASICTNATLKVRYSVMDPGEFIQALTNCVHAYVKYSSSQIVVLNCFLTGTFTNTRFQFPE